jgi:hypothetical protein
MEQIALACARTAPDLLFDRTATALDVIDPVSDEIDAVPAALLCW